ncbi:hypothetical protein VNO78_20644 [Psophocarpus tetragonolobus]|uniref:Uncharacterized protein n=1 Tax=Psophocarpus tetragonolobus TaxID=3891 RepID=A0AAN9XHC5_PSOTE
MFYIQRVSSVIPSKFQLLINRFFCSSFVLGVTEKEITRRLFAAIFPSFAVSFHDQINFILSPLVIIFSSLFFLSDLVLACLVSFLSSSSCSLTDLL